MRLPMAPRTLQTRSRKRNGHYTDKEHSVCSGGQVALWVPSVGWVGWALVASALGL